MAGRAMELAGGAEEFVWRLENWIRQATGSGSEVEGADLAALTVV